MPYLLLLGLIVGALLLIFGPWPVSRSIRARFSKQKAPPAGEPDPLADFQAKVDQEQAAVHACRAAVSQCQGQLSAWSRQLGDAEKDAQQAQQRAAACDDRGQSDEAKKWFGVMQAKQAQAEALHHQWEEAQARYQTDVQALRAAQARLDGYRQEAVNLNLELKLTDAEVKLSDLQDQMSSPIDDDGIEAARAAVRARIDAGRAKVEVSRDLRSDAPDAPDAKTEGTAEAAPADDAFAQWQRQRQSARSQSPQA